MATPTDSEIVELIIDAKNLTSDELNQAATDVEGLGAAARKTESELDKLKIKRDTIQSYEQVSASVKDLRKELADAEVSYENLAKATKQNKDATDEERASVKLSKKALDDMKSSLREQEREYRALTKTVKQYGVTASNSTDRQEELTKQIDASKDEVSRLTAEYKKQGSALKDKLVAEKASAQSLKDQADELEKLVKEEEKALVVSRKRAAQEAKEAAETKRVTDGLKIYERELSKLNNEKQAGTTSNAEYIRGEARLRKELKLTEGQVKTSRAAIQADSVEKGKAAKNTDLLTSATRRLAQVYTVLLAAQKAVQAVGTGVQGYGELEAAITKVEKTTGLAREQVAAMADELKTLSEDVTPTTTNEMLRFAEVAGQLGTKSADDILNLVSASDALERSTNLAGDEAAELLARILQMTKEGIPQIHNLSSSVVALGNDFAVSEQDIVHMTKEIISGTREINLGSAAAAAFGTALKELGQPAERSRTAIQRLGGAIKAASIEGGDDLERLVDITGMTADEIEQNLGERPEKVLVAFLQGLNRIDEAGGQASNALRTMGIDGTEATGVLTVLAGGVDRLTDALALSNEQFVRGDAHIKEAVKSYADQESALGRLANRFHNLTSAIGEAFSDETDLAVRSLGDALESTEGDVISIMEYLPELVQGLLEMGSAIDGLVETFTGDTGIGAITGLFETIRFSFNGITLLLNQMVVNIQSVALEVAKLQNQFVIFDDMKISDKFITDLEASIAKSRERITQDMADIDSATKRLSGESSSAFEGLTNVVDRYSGAVDQLGEKQKAAIDLIINKTGYVQGEDEQYRKLTAAIVRANRELEIEAELKKRANQESKEKTSQTAVEVSANESVAESQGKINVSLTDYTTIVAKVMEDQAEFTQLRKDGLIDTQTEIELNNALTQSLNQYNVVQEQASTLVNRQITDTQTYLQARANLDAQNKAGLLTDRELVLAQQDLAAEYANTTRGAEVAATASDILSRSQVNLNNKITQSEKVIRDLNTELLKGNLAKNESAEITAKLAKEEAKLNDLKQEQVRLQEIESATYPQLVALQREYQLELERINSAFQAGTLTKAEYEQQTRAITQALNELNGVLGDNTEEVDENTESIRRNKDEREGLGEASDKVTQFMSLEVAVAQELNKTYDKSGESLESLRARYDELQASIVRNDRVNVGFMANLAKLSNEVFQQEQAAIQAELSVRDWTAQIESGSLSIEELNRLVQYSNLYFRELSDQQLDGLMASIDKARSKFNDLVDDINDAINDVDDRLDAALGNFEEITRRKFEAEIKELELLLEQAQVAGNAELVRKVEQAIRDLKRAQDLEFQAEYGGGGSSGGTSSSTSETSPVSSSHKVEIVLPSGQTTTVQTASQADSNSLVSLLTQLGSTNNQGNA